MTPAQAPTAFAGCRAVATARAAAVGLPTTAAEAWRYVDVKPLAQAPAGTPRTITTADVAPLRLSGCRLVVLVDGALRSDLGDPDSGAESLAALPAAEAASLDQRWSACAATSEDITALWTLTDLAGGLRLRLRGTATAPLQILSLTSGGCSGARLVIEAARGAVADLVLHHVALAPSRSSIGIELDLADGAVVRVDELQLGETAQLFSLAWPRLARDASLSWCSIGIGGQCVRQRIKGVLNGAQSSLSLSGLALLGGTRQHHQYLRVRHAVGANRSQQLYKTIADGKSLASFDGLIDVALGADQTDAEQTNHNLLLSPGARVDTRPQLDILADDVKAAHGATVGQLDPDELFYLRARGLSLADARSLLIQGFALDITGRLACPAARERAEAAVLTALGGGT